MTERQGPEILVRGIIRDSDERILLVRHTSRPWWFLPGGHLKRNEYVKDALRRELMEEASLELDPHDLVGVIEHIYSENGEERIELNIILEASVTSLLGAVEDGLKFHWFAVDEMVELDVRPAFMKALCRGGSLPSRPLLLHLN